MKRFILFLTITALVFAAGISTKGRRDIKPTTIFQGGISGTDSLHILPSDTVNMWIGEQIKDTLGQEIVVIQNQLFVKDTLHLNNTDLVSSNGWLDIYPSTGVEIHGAALNVSGGDIEATNNTVKVDSINANLGRIGTLDASGINLSTEINNRGSIISTEITQGADSTLQLSQQKVEIVKNKLIFGNDAEIENDSTGALKLHADSLYLDGITIIQGETTIDNITKVNDNITFENNAIIDNSALGQLTITEDAIVLNADSTYAVNVFKTNTAYVGTSRITNTEADSLKFTELNSVFKGNLKTTGLFSLTNGTTTTFTQALNRLTISGGDSLSIRNMTNINPYRATSPQTSTYLGMLAGKVGTTGTGNVVMGYRAGAALTTGSYNTISGSYSGHYNTTGYYNTFSGNSSGFSNISGYGNTFSGFYSGYSNTTGYYNTFSGSYSGHYNTTGYYNTFSGNSSGYANTTGYYNTFSGNSSGRNNTTASYGVAIGDSSGFRNTIGSNNIFLGYKSGGNNTTGRRNMFLGDFKGYTSADSMLYIDNTGKDSTATPLITGNMGSGVNRGVTIDGILTLTPVATAHRPTSPVNGTIYIDATTNTVKVYINGAWYNVDMTAE